MSEIEIINILNNNLPFFKIGNVINDMFRGLMWIVVNFLVKISDGMESVLNKIYTFNTFFDSPEIQTIINTFKPVCWSILVISVVYIGYQLIINRDFKGEKILQNVILSMMVIMILPTLMVKLNEITNESINVIQGIGSNSSNPTTATTLIKENVYDLLYLKEKGFKINSDTDKSNNIGTDKILKININSTMDRTLLGTEIFDNKVEIDENGEEKVVKLNKTFFGFINEEYYRYNFDFFTIIVSLLVMILALVLTCIKIARINLELAFNKIFAMIYAFGDIAGGQKLKEILKHIFSMFAIIFTTALLLKIYMLSMTWINSLDVGIVTRLVLIIGSSLMLIDAPNIVERILGIDAGIKSGWSLVAGGYSAMKIGGKLLSGATSTIAGATSGIKGVADGFNSSTLEDERNSSGESTSNSTSNSKSTNDNSSSNSSNTNNVSDNERYQNIPKSSDKQAEGNSIEDMNSTANDDNTSGINNELDENISNGYGQKYSLSQAMGENIGINSLESDVSSKGLSEDSVSNQDTSTLNEDISSNGLNGVVSEDSVSNQDTSTLNEDISSNGLNGAVSEDSVSNQGKSALSEDISSDGFKGLSDGNLDKQNIANNDLSKDMNEGKEQIKSQSTSSSSSLEGNKQSKNETQGKDNIEKYTRNTNTFGDVAKGRIENSKPVMTAKKSYQVGLNTGVKLRDTFNKKKNRK